LGDEGVSVAWDRCQLEAACVEVCLPGALELVGEMKTVDEVVDLLEDDRIYFDESRGGVTFSGGEPFSQPGFLRELLNRCKQRELPVVLDTCGHVEPDLFQELAPLAAHLLFDLKLMDEDRHDAYTGVHNRWILRNLEWVGNEIGPAGKPGPELTVRIPLIPGVNDDEENLLASARFLARLRTPPPVDILPYHRLGVDKYDRMGREYGLGAVTPPSQDAVLLACRLLGEAGLRVTVRGEQHGDD